MYGKGPLTVLEKIPPGLFVPEHAMQRYRKILDAYKSKGHDRNCSDTQEFSSDSPRNYANK